MKMRLVAGHSGKPGDKLRLKVAGDESQRLVFRDCHHVIIEDAAVKDWWVRGDILKGKYYGITFENCSSVEIEAPLVVGAPDDFYNDEWEYWAAAWAGTVGNGILVGPTCKDVRIIQPVISRVHIGVCNRGVGTRLLGGEIKKISGDHVQNLESDFKMIGTTKKWVIPCLEYAKWHTDAFQVFDRAFDANKPELSGWIEDITVRDCIVDVTKNLTVHPYCKDGQAYLFSDGKGRRFDISNNDITVAHEIAILLNPCSYSVVEDNKITAKNGVKVACGFEDRKKYGVQMVDVRAMNNIIQTDQDRKMVDVVKNDYFPSRESRPLPEPVNHTFESVVMSLKNLNAERVTEFDYESAAVRLGVGVVMIKAVAKVESRGRGFNDDGSVKLLYERHIFRRQCVKACIKAKIPIEEIEGRLDGNVINKKIGGYKGGIAEYWRASKAGNVGEWPVTRGNVTDGGHGVDFIMLALASCSMGEFQTMGFNHKLCGFETPLHMIQAYHQSEVSQLNAFCSFIENAGLVKHLRAAEKLINAGKNPRPSLSKFAVGYNGKGHKNYDLKIAAEYDRLLDKPIEFKKKRNSDTLQGGAITGVGGAGIAYGLNEARLLIEKLSAGRDQAAVLVEKLDGDLSAVKDKLTESAGDYQQLTIVVYVLVACLVVSNIGTIKSMLARLRDRAKGIH